MSLSKDQCIQKVQRQIGPLRDKVESDAISQALDTTLMETGWTLPTSDSFIQYWIISRTKRHLFYTLLSSTAYKFKFKQINLQNRFEHFAILVKDADRQFKDAIEEHPDKFTNVSVVHAFGTKIDAGFAYNIMGHDLTYASDNVTALDPEV